MLRGLRTLKDKGMTKAMLETEDFNLQTMGLYGKVGFEVMQEYSTYEKRLHPEISSG